MLTVFVSDAVVTAVILNTTFICALTSLARANNAVKCLLQQLSKVTDLASCRSPCAVGTVCRPIGIYIHGEGSFQRFHI